MGFYKPSTFGYPHFWKPPHDVFKRLPAWSHTTEQKKGTAMRIWSALSKIGAQSPAKNEIHFTLLGTNISNMSNNMSSYHSLSASAVSPIFLTKHRVESLIPVLMAWLILLMLSKPNSLICFFIPSYHLEPHFSWLVAPSLSHNIIFQMGVS